MTKHSTLLSRPWSYYISRNVPNWHNSAGLAFEHKGMQDLRLPGFLQCKASRGFHSDFYHVKEGALGHTRYMKALSGQFENKGYITSMERKYRSHSKKLLQKARRAHTSARALKSFFEWYGRCTALLDFTATSSALITDTVIELLDSHPQSDDIIAYYGRPRTLAPVQKMEREIERLTRRPLSDKKISEYAEKLHRKWFWIPVSFVGDPWDITYFEKRLRNPLPRTKQPAAPRVKLTPEQRYYLGLLGKIASLNEYRKSVFTRANVILWPYFDAIAPQGGLLNRSEVGLLTHTEIMDLAAGKLGPYVSVAKKRAKPWLMYTPSFGNIQHLYGSPVRAFQKKFEKKVDGKEVKGVAAHKGRVQGTARIVLEPSDFKRFKKGDVLIAKMTSVDFIPIMKRAAAFITDEGGLACHAAIVSRELGKPCIVGTKVATQAFKSGDTVVVDADKGIIKRAA